MLKAQEAVASHGTPEFIRYSKIYDNIIFIIWEDAKIAAVFRKRWECFVEAICSQEVMEKGIMKKKPCLNTQEFHCPLPKLEKL